LARWEPPWEFAWDLLRVGSLIGIWKKKNNEKLENAIIEALENAKIKIKSDMRDKLYGIVKNTNNKYCDEIKKIR